MKRRASRASPAAILILLVVPAPATADSRVSVQPAAALPGTTVALRGDGFRPRARMRVGTRAAVLARSRADRRGRFSASVVAPAGAWRRLRLLTSGGGRKVVSIVARAGARARPPEGEVASATGARVRWSPTRGFPGDELLLRGSGLKPSARVRVRFAATASKANASRHGAFRWRMSIPSVPAGRLRGVVRARSVALPFDVVVGTRPFPLPRPGMPPIISPPAPGDTSAPAAPLIRQPTNGSLLNTPIVAVSGTAEPRSTVTVGDRSTTADDAGAWTLALTLAEGQHDLTATATDTAGNTSPPSTVTRVTVDSVPPAPPVIKEPADDTLVNTPQITIAGTAEPRSTVAVGDRSTTADDAGAWTLALTLAEGSHDLTATATDTAGNTSPPSTVTRVTVRAPVIAGAGDIASSGSGDEATAKLLDGMPDLAAVFTTGDNAYPDGTDANYAAYYEPTWGRHKARTRPVPGNHEYHVTDAGGYFNYFADSAGARAKGWYSYDVGAWHLIALNSSSTGSTCSPIPCGPGSEQHEWLQADLAAHPNKCVLAYWHHPLHSRGNYTPGIAGVKPLWDLLYDNGADLVLNGHDHNYQRFAPMDKTGARDDLLGIREFVIGEGGTNSQYAVEAPGGNLEASQSGTHGVLRLVLHPTSYDWEFVPVAGKTFTDVGSGACH